MKQRQVTHGSLMCNSAVTVSIPWKHRLHNIKPEGCNSPTENYNLQAKFNFCATL